MGAITLPPDCSVRQGFSDHDTLLRLHRNSLERKCKVGDEFLSSLLIDLKPISYQPDYAKLYGLFLSSNRTSDASETAELVAEITNESAALYTAISQIEV